MPKTLFCFSDMEFDMAGGNCQYSVEYTKEDWVIPWKTDLEQIRDKYKRAGYDVPHNVFWNFRTCVIQFLPQATALLKA